MKIAFIKSNTSKLIPIVPSIMQKYKDHEIFIQSGIGEFLNWNDSDFIANNDAINVTIIDNINTVNNCDIIVTSDNFEINNFKINTDKVIIGTFSPYQNIDKLKKSKATIYSLDMILRSTKAQYMDVLSSLSNLAGYKAVVYAADKIDKTIPMLITSAGTLPAAKFLIIGAGVAGLQAIATARRLGAKVSAFDVRASAAEQVESLGAKFIAVDEQSDGVYAQETSQAYKELQAKKLLEVLPDQDVVITTAQIPGKSAPKIITKNMISVMKPSSIIIDLASKTGGNCEYIDNKVLNFDNICDFMPVASSTLYARNILEFIKYYQNNYQNSLDEILTSTLIAKNGNIVHPKLLKFL